MVYIFTDNFYLRNGIEHAMFPIKVACIDADYFVSKTTTPPEDIFLIDDNSIYSELFFQHFSISHTTKFIIINTNRNIKPDFFKINLGYSFVDKITTPNELPRTLENILKKMTVRLILKTKVN